MNTWASWATSIVIPQSPVSPSPPCTVCWSADWATPVSVVLRCSMHSVIVMWETACRSSPRQTWVSRVVMRATPDPSVKSNRRAAATGSVIRYRMIPLKRSGMPSFVSCVNSNAASWLAPGTSTWIDPGGRNACTAEPRFSSLPPRPTSRYWFGRALTNGTRRPSCPLD